MKTKTFLCVIIAIAAFFVGCKEVSQSEFSLDTLTEKAVISGQIVYDAGVDVTSAGAFSVNEIVPAAGKTVFVEVPYSAYNMGSSGVKKYETVTDENGYYRIEIPMSISAINNVVVRMQEFTAYRSEYRKMEAGKPVFDTRLYTFSYNTSLTLKPGSINVIEDSNKNCTYECVDLEEMEEQITLTGNIQLAQEQGYRHGVYNAAANTTVEFEVGYKGYSKYFTFGAMTDNSGNYSITLPLKSYEEGFTYLKAYVKGFYQNFTHYTSRYNTAKIKGIYESSTILELNNFTNIVEGMEYKMPVLYMRFTPGYNNQLAPEVIPVTWKENLAGWEKYSDFPETKTVTGKCLFATESSYGVGTYTNKNREAIIYIDYGYNSGERLSKNVFVNTSEDGTFSFDVPVENSLESITFSFSNNIEGQIEHYMPTYQIATLEGHYYKYKTVKDSNAPWYDLGTTYYKFTPENVTAEMGWSNSLSGWVINN